MSTAPTPVDRGSSSSLPQTGTLSVRIYVVVPFRVKAWLEEEADRNGLALSAFTRQLLTRASSASSSSSSAGDA